MEDPFRRLWMGLLALGVIMASGTLGYVGLGFPGLDALYQTVITVTTVGFREVRELSATGKVFTMVLILAGTGTALYTFSVLLETLVEGQLRNRLQRRRMERQMAATRGT